MIASAGIGGAFGASASAAEPSVIFSPSCWINGGPTENVTFVGRVSEARQQLVEFRRVCDKGTLNYVISNPF